MRFACGRCDECEAGNWERCLEPRGRDPTEPKPPSSADRIAALEARCAQLVEAMATYTAAHARSICKCQVCAVLTPDVTQSAEQFCESVRAEERAKYETERNQWWTSHNAVVAKEREACAKVAEADAAGRLPRVNEFEQVAEDVAMNIAAAIRARGKDGGT